MCAIATDRRRRSALWRAQTSFRSQSSALAMDRSQPQARSAPAERRPDVIHAHFGPDATYILPTAERQSIPLMVTFHGADATSMWRGSKPSVYKHRLRRLFAHAHVLHAVSDFHCESAFLPSERLPRRSPVCTSGFPVAVKSPPRDAHNSPSYLSADWSRKRVSAICLPPSHSCQTNLNPQRCM